MWPYAVFHTKPSFFIQRMRNISTVHRELTTWFFVSFAAVVIQPFKSDKDVWNRSSLFWKVCSRFLEACFSLSELQSVRALTSSCAWVNGCGGWHGSFSEEVCGWTVSTYFPLPQRHTCKHTRVHTHTHTFSLSRQMKLSSKSRCGSHFSCLNAHRQKNIHSNKHRNPQSPGVRSPPAAPVHCG